MPRHILPLLLMCCPLAVTLLTPSAIAQQCRTTCTAREIVDIDGCCAPLELTPPMVTLPDTAGLKVELDWSSNPQAHHFSAKTPAPQAGPPELPAPTLDPVTRRKRSWAAWGGLLALEDQIRRRGELCHELDQSPPDRRACVASFRAERDAREAFLGRAVPLWTSHLGGLREGEIEYTKTKYYLGTGLILLRFHREGAKHLQELIEQDRESPYALFALATMGDFFYGQNTPELATPLFLRASQDGPPALRAYSLYMVGWSMAMKGDLPRALEAMLKSWQLAKTPGMYLGETLREVVLRDMTEFYAQIGAGAKAAEFYRRLGLPAIAQSVWLERLQKRYIQLGKKDAAQAIYPSQARPRQGPGSP